MAAINAFVPAIIAFTADTVAFAVVLTAAADAFAVARAACAAFWAVLADAFAAACADLAVVCVVLMAAFEVACAVLTDFCVVLTVSVLRSVHGSLLLPDCCLSALLFPADAPDVLSVPPCLPDGLYFLRTHQPDGRRFLRMLLPGVRCFRLHRSDVLRLVLHPDVLPPDDWKTLLRNFLHSADGTPA